MAKRMDDPNERWTKFPDSVRCLYEDQWQEVAGLHIKWATYLDLFDQRKNIDLFSATAPGFFRVVEEALRMDMIMSVGRLLDPPQSVGRANLSLSRLVTELNPHCDEGFLALLRAEVEAVRTHCNQFKEWRNRRISHNDLNTALKSQPLPAIQRSYVEEALRRIENLLNRIALHFRESETRFTMPIIRGPAKDLIFWLERGHQFEDQDRRRMQRGGA